MPEHLRFIEIIIKTSHLFADCDGNYSNQEDAFIKGYIETLCENQVIDAESKDRYSAINASSLEELVSEINDFMEQFNEIEKQKIKETLLTFADNVIKADGVIDNKEETLYNEFANMIG